MLFNIVQRGVPRTLRAVVPFLPLGLAVGIFLVYFLVMCAYARSVISFPFDYDQGEGFELYDGIRLARGSNIYLDNSTYPFYASNYPPLYRLALVPLIWVFGPNLWVARALTFLCTLGIGAVIYLAVRQPSQRNRVHHLSTALWMLIPIIAALAFFASNYVYQIAPLARAHLPMVLLTISGIALIDRAASTRATVWPSISANRAIYVGVFLLVAAGFTKLQAVDALAAGFGFLLIRNPRLWLKLFLISALTSAALVVLINAASSGQFWLNVVAANVNEYRWDQTIGIYKQFWELQAPLIVCGFVYVGVDFFRAFRARSLQIISIWSLYFLAGCAMGLLTGKWGAGPVYLIGCIAASCVCAGRLKNMVILRPRLATTLACMVFLFQAALNVHLPTSGRLFGTVAKVIGRQDDQSSYPPYPYFDSIGYTQLGHLLDEADARHGWEIVTNVREARGPVWSEEAMFTLLAGKDVVSNPTQLYNLSKANMLDTREMIRLLDQKAFGAVVFRAQFYPKDVLGAIGRNYQWPAAPIKMNGFDYWVLTPLP